MPLDLTHIRSSVRFHATGDNANTNFASADVDRLANDAYIHLVATIQSMCGNKGIWELPESTQSIGITAGVNAYNMESMMLIRRVEIKYPDSDIHREAEYVDLWNLGDKGVDDYIASGTNKYTFINGQIVVFLIGTKKADIQAVPAGIRIYHYDDITLLASASDVMKITPVCVEYVSRKAARDYQIINRMFAEADRQKQDIKELRDIIVSFYRQRTMSNRNLGVRREPIEGIGMQGGWGHNPSINGK